MKKITITEVAEEAGVSISTVSRVLNNAPNVTDAYRERILEAIEKLDYQPSRAARSMKKQLQDMIGYLIPGLTHSIFGSVISHAEVLAYENKIGILAYSTGDDVDRQKMYLDLLQKEQVAGIVMVPSPGTDVEMLNNIQAQGISIVLLDRQINGFAGDCVASDNFQGAYNGTKHLIDLGYTRIATIAGSQYITSGINRLNGFKYALSEANLAIDDDWIQVGDFDKDKSYHAVKTLVESDYPPEAVFVANDFMMVGALHAFHDLNINVPEDIAVVGFDELSLAPVLNPPLTTIEQSSLDLGRESFRLLLERIEKRDRPPRFIQIPTRLNVRRSCGSMAASRLSK